MQFQFDIDQLVAIVASGETGTVTARSEHRHSEDQYLIEYKNAQGVAVVQWWGESSLRVHSYV